MKITSLELFKVAPRWLFLKTSTDEGICGWGEPLIEGRADTVAACVKELEPYVIGRDPAQIEDKALNLISEVDRMLFECGCRKTAGSDVSEFENATGLSIGIVWADKPAIASDMFVQADSALYDAKRAGKNRFEITRNMGTASE